MATGVGAWSTTANNNGNSDSAISAVEGATTISSINNNERAIMAALATFVRDGGWIPLADLTYTYASATTVTVTTDVTASHPVGRRVRAVGSSTGTIYGVITASSYSNPTTTLTFRWDSGSLSNEALTISVSLMQATGKPVNSGMAVIQEQSISAGVATFTDFVDIAQYNSYKLAIRNFIPATDNISVAILYSTDGTSFISGAASYRMSRVSAVDASMTAEGGPQQAIFIAANLGNDHRLNGEVNFSNLGIATEATCYWTVGYRNSGDAVASATGSGVHVGNTNAVTAIKVGADTGNGSFTGVLTMYGLRR